ncbi:MAG: hypothetical protein M1833_003059 [Piccolia ochrophora]|nr:MAG: hypothetical protein M1833_003059 [Piccolia ochrophora]
MRNIAESVAWEALNVSEALLHFLISQVIYPIKTIPIKLFLCFLNKSMGLSLEELPEGVRTSLWCKDFDVSTLVGKKIERRDYEDQPLKVEFYFTDGSQLLLSYEVKNRFRDEEAAEFEPEVKMTDNLSEHSTHFQTSTIPSSQETVQHLSKFLLQLLQSKRAMAGILWSIV